MNVFYAISEKYPLDYVFVYNFLSPYVCLFLLEHVRAFVLNIV